VGFFVAPVPWTAAPTMHMTSQWYKPVHGRSRGFGTLGASEILMRMFAMWFAACTAPIPGGQHSLESTNSISVIDNPQLSSTEINALVDAIDSHGAFTTSNNGP